MTDQQEFHHQALPGAWMTGKKSPQRLLAASGLAVAVLAVTAPTLAGGETGAGIQLGGAFTFLDEYAQVIGRNVVPGAGGFIPARLSVGAPR